MVSSTLERPKIVVAWDGSRPSATTFPIASVIGAQLGADVEILHVLPSGASRQEFEEAVREVGLDALEAFRLRIETGEVVGRLLAATEEPGVILAILATHVSSIKEGRDLGGVAKAVIIGTNRPVLLVRPEVSLVPRELRRLLLPVDGTPKTAIALRPATALARCLSASLDLLYVAGRESEAPDERGSIGAPRYVDQPQHEWPGWANEVAERLATLYAQCPADVQVFLGQGDIGTEIEKFALEHASDAVVLVRRSRLQTGRARILRAVLERTPCPVLVLGGPATSRPRRAKTTRRTHI
jgi:nucleotide-binding universal stress UspA family protein